MDSDDYVIYVINRGWMTRGIMHSDVKEALHFTHEAAVTRAKKFNSSTSTFAALVIPYANITELQ